MLRLPPAAQRLFLLKRGNLLLCQTYSKEKETHPSCCLGGVPYDASAGTTRELAAHLALHNTETPPSTTSGLKVITDVEACATATSSRAFQISPSSSSPPSVHPRLRRKASSSALTRRRGSVVSKALVGVWGGAWGSYTTSKDDSQAAV